MLHVYRSGFQTIKCSNAQRISAQTTTILRTISGTSCSLNCFDHRIYMQLISTYKNITKLFTWKISDSLLQFSSKGCVCICLCFPPDRTWHKINDSKVCGTIASRHQVGRWFRDYHMCRLVFLYFFPRPRCFQIRGKRRWLRSSRWRLEFVLERWKSCQANFKNDKNKAFVINSNKRLFTQLFR